MAHDASGAHACDELGISETLRAPYSGGVVFGRAADRELSALRVRLLGVIINGSVFAPTPSARANRLFELWAR